MFTIKQSKSELWFDRIMECRASGLSDAQWCRENNIKAPTFYYWVKKLRIERSKPNNSLAILSLRQEQAVVPIHADETTVQVLKEEGKTPTSTSYIWLYRTGNWDKKTIVLFQYKPSRSGSNAKEYLQEFHGYLHTDGYAGYEKVEGIQRVGCWAHVRRKFVEAMPPGVEKLLVPCTAEVGKHYCDQLFKLEKELVDLSAHERKEQRLKQELPILGAFWCWLDTVTALKNSKLSKAVVYARNQKDYLENYLKNGNCSLSNNIAENSIRPFCVGRKNWLFSQSVKGAKASAAIYSVIETAKANGINPMHYLQYVFTYMPGSDMKDPENLESLMPWSKRYQDFIK